MISVCQIFPPSEGGKPAVNAKDIPLTLPAVLGRGALLKCAATKVSRRHATLDWADEDGITVQAIHNNPTYVVVSAVASILGNGQSATLQHGDMFGMLPHAAWYRVSLPDCNVTKEETTKVNGSETIANDAEGEDKHSMEKEVNIDVQQKCDDIKENDINSNGFKKRKLCSDDEHQSVADSQEKNTASSSSKVNGCSNIEDDKTELNKADAEETDTRQDQKKFGDQNTAGVIKKAKADSSDEQTVTPILPQQAEEQERRTPYVNSRARDLPRWMTTTSDVASPGATAAAAAASPGATTAVASPATVATNKTPARGKKIAKARKARAENECNDSSDEDDKPKRPKKHTPRKLKVKPKQNAVAKTKDVDYMSYDEGDEKKEEIEQKCNHSVNAVKQDEENVCNKQAESALPLEPSIKKVPKKQTKIKVQNHARFHTFSESDSDSEPEYDKQELSPISTPYKKETTMKETPTKKTPTKKTPTNKTLTNKTPIKKATKTDASEATGSTGTTAMATPVEAASTSTSTAELSVAAVAKRNRKQCRYGAQCYRSNPQHRVDESHPGDSDYKESSGSEAGDEDERPECEYGVDCYRKNPQHRRDYKHTRLPQPTRRAKRNAQRKKNQGNDEDYDSNDSYDYDDPFFNDDSTDDYAPTDSGSDEYFPSQPMTDYEKNNLRRMNKEAKKFINKK